MSYFLRFCKHSTCVSYKAIIKNHIIPNLGGIALSNLMPHHIQSFYNRLSAPTDDREPTVKNIHGVLHRAMQQLANRLLYGACYEDSGFVFTDELGHHLSPQAVYRDFKKVQANLGHATAAFTLDVYGHVTEKMKQDSANRMEPFIRLVTA